MSYSYIQSGKTVIYISCFVVSVIFDHRDSKWMLVPNLKNGINRVVGGFIFVPFGHGVDFISTVFYLLQ